MYFLMTVDVESFSIPLNTCDQGTAHQVHEVGLPRLINLLSKYDMEATFYFTGEIASLLPQTIDLVKDHGHEIGCHGYHHDVDTALDNLSYDEQLKEITDAKKVIESVSGTIESFRAPALRINEDTIKVLVDTHFKTDSSVCPQRFDGPLTFGSKRKLKWLIAPRKPYFLDNGSSILEIPISAFIFPYIGTTMRVSRGITQILEKMLFYESMKTGKPVVFLFHPNECLDLQGKIVATRRSDNPVMHLFADRLRQRLKLSNLGVKAIERMDTILHNAKETGFEFVTASEFRRKYRVIP
jgi:peptidoglycan/xylan/chitin deacetylase (PgdA/CDA1 family)